MIIRGLFALSKWIVHRIGSVSQSAGLFKHIVGSGQKESVLANVVVAGAVESSVHVGSGPLEYGTPGMMTGVVASVVAGYMPEVVVRLRGSVTSGEDCIASPLSSDMALAAIQVARTLAN